MQTKNITEMRALSIMQPWATCILLKGKNVENRPRITHLRGTIAIHASARKDQDRFDWLKSEYGIRIDSSKTPFGAVIGFADIVEVVTKKKLTSRTKKWFSGEFGYVLENIVILKEPVPAKGALGFWRLKGAPLKKCLRQIAISKQSRFKPLEKPRVRS